MAHDLGLTVVAAGVERIEQTEVLSGMGCKFAQGFFTSNLKKAEAFV